jgi:dTDP-4-dehydrorhamnose reductase
MTPMRVLVIGQQGQLAQALVRLCGDNKIDCETIGRPTMDLTDPARTGPALSARLSRALKPNIVINTAAYTQVDAAERDPETAKRVNAIAAGEIALACATADIPLLHISTDYVYAGDFDRPLLEEDTTQPASVYGRTKLDGEQAIAANWQKHVIVRAAWLYGGAKDNFYATINALSQTRETLKVVDDQTGCPTFAPNLADVLLEVSRHILSGKPSWGIFNYCDDTAMSWSDFAKKIVLANGRTECRIIPVTTLEYGAQASRPAWSVLDCTRINRAYGIEQASFDKALQTSARPA